jgi:CheY-like chemotaxis protein
MFQRERPRLLQSSAVLATAYARVEDRLRALSAGFQIHVRKPVEPLQLVTAVAKVADSKSARLH